MLNAIIQFQTAKSLENGQNSMKEVKKSFHKVSAYQITFKHGTITHRSGSMLSLRVFCLK